MRRLGAVLALCIALPAYAECKKDDFNRYLAAAVRLYEALDYERALTELSKAKDNACGADDDAVLGMYEGIIRSDLGQTEQAKAAFKEALLLKPETEIPLKVSPKVKKQIEALRAEAKKELAPILARQEEERRKHEAEEQKRAAELRRVEEQRASAEAARHAEEARRAEAHRNEEAAKEKQQGVVIEKLPDVHETSPAVDVRADVKTRRTPVVPIIVGALGLASGGVGVYFGVTSRHTQDEARSIDTNQELRQSTLNLGNQQALIADILFGVAGALAIATVVSIFAIPVGDADGAAK